MSLKQRTHKNSNNLRNQWLIVMNVIQAIKKKDAIHHATKADSENIRIQEIFRLIKTIKQRI